MKSDMISRKAAIDLFCELLDTTEENPVTCIRQVLDILPPERVWIPVEELLPKEDGEYLCWGNDISGSEYTDSDEECYAMLMDFYTKEGKFGLYYDVFDFDGNGRPNEEFHEVNVKAWCNIPAPFDGE